MSYLPPVGFFGTPGTPEILVIMVAVLLLFGAKRLPEIARNLGKSMEMFRRAARDVTDEIVHGDAEEKGADTPAALLPARSIEAANTEPVSPHPPEDSDPSGDE